ncbi:unnamed protein product [Calypogeia fissa]
MTNLTHYSKQLRAVRLNFTPCVSGRGLLSLVSGCYTLSLLHINRLMFVRVLEWLEFIGKNRRIESLAIRNCKGVGEFELAKLGFRGWQNLREFFYEVDVVHRPTGDFFGHNGRGASLLNAWRFPAPQGAECCPNMEVLSLTNCLSMSGTGTAWLLSQCKALRVLQVDTCVGVQDRDLLVLAQNSSQISSISLRVPCHVPTSDAPPMLTDVALLAIAHHCHFLETMRLSFAHGDFFPSFTGAGIVAIVEQCTRLRVLSLDRAYPFTDSTMLAVCQSESLESLELINCHEVTDEGLKLVAGSNLTELKVCRCFGLTEAWLTPLRASKTLARLNVEDCPEISQEAILGAADVVSYKCTYPWNYMDQSV